MIRTPSEAIAAIRDVLDRHGVGPVDLQRLRFTDALVTEAQDGETVLSNAILDFCFPHANTGREYAHYTTFSTFQNVLRSGEWRLYSVIRRISEHEYGTFCADHGLDGYLQMDPHTGQSVYETNCRDLFYTSLTGYPSPNESRMWHDFGEQGRGVRLIFRIQPAARRSEFRPVRYRNARSRTLIQELRELVSGRLSRRLSLMGESRIAAFYLPMLYDDEEECRLLIKRFNVPNMPSNPWDIAQMDGLFEYLPIPLNTDATFCRVDLIRVDAGPHRNPADVDVAVGQYPQFKYLDRRERVRMLAYSLWEQRGCPWGDSLRDWLEAKRILNITDNSI